MESQRRLDLESAGAMGTARLEAFSDGVIAIIITIMVLEMKVPHGDDATALRALVPVFSSYVLSFVYLGIYWNNHHHLLHACQRINGRIMWANLHLLFWLSLIPFVTGWVGENRFAALPMALYGGVLFMAAIAYLVLQQTIIANHPEGSVVGVALAHDVKGRTSALCYAVAIPLAFVNRWIAGALYVAVALMWFVPDRRIASRVG